MMKSRILSDVALLTFLAFFQILKAEDFTEFLRKKEMEAHQSSIDSSFTYLLNEIDRKVLSEVRVRVDLPDGNVIWVKTVEMLPGEIVAESRELKSWKDFINICSQDVVKSKSKLENVWRLRNESGSLIKDASCILPFLIFELNGGDHRKAFPTPKSIEDYFSQMIQKGSLN